MNYTLTTKISWSQTLTELKHEFSLWGVEWWDITTPRGYRLSGYNQSEEDRTVILSYKKNNKEIVLKMGKQGRAVDNLRVLYLAISSMRMNEKRGIGDVLESAYKQLGSGISESTAFSDFDPYQVLGIREDATLETAEAVYRSLATKYHPDSKPDGSQEMMSRLNVAIKIIREQSNEI